MLVLSHTLHQVARHASIKGAITLACKNINSGISIHPLFQIET